MTGDNRLNYPELQASLAPIAGAKRWWLAFSGGLDSTVLLHMLVTWRQAADWPGAELRAIHINHGLSPHADNWQSHCESLCRQWDVPLQVELVSVDPDGKGIEAAARAARYEAIAKYLRAADGLLTAHHSDDQAETLLLRLLRGTGTRGLTGMARNRRVAACPVVRPLLLVNRNQLQNYADQHGLTYCEDESNRNQDFDRNFLRHEIFPRLGDRWPGFTQRWSRTAQLLADDDSALAELAAMDLQTCELESARLGWAINSKKLRELSSPRRHNLLRHWCDQCDLPLPESKHLYLVDRYFAETAISDDKNLAVHWAGVELRRFNGRLYLLPSKALAHRADFGWSQQLAGGDVCVSLPDGSQLQLRAQIGGLRDDLGPLTLRLRKGGERCQPQWRQHSQTLKKCLQEVGLEPWLRDQLPLIYAGETLVAVGDLWVSAGFAAAENEDGIKIHWHYPKNKT